MVVLVLAKAVRSMNRVELTSDACARSPCRDSVTATSVSAVAPLSSDDGSYDTSVWNSSVLPHVAPGCLGTTKWVQAGALA